MPSKHSFLWKASLPTFFQNIALKERGFGRCRAAQKDSSFPLAVIYILLYDCFLDAVNDVLDIIIGNIRAGRQAEADFEEGF